MGRIKRVRDKRSPISAYRGALGLLLAACAGCSGPQAHGSAQSTDPVLNVYNWSDYIQPTVISDFEKQYGIQVNYDVFDSNEILETKLLTGNTGYDIVVPSGPFLERQIQADVYQKLDKALLPNLKNVDPEVARATALYDPGNRYSVDYMWVTSGIGYNVKEIRARMPDAPVDSWRMVFDPAIVSQIRRLRRVGARRARGGGRAPCCCYLGRNPDSDSPADLKAAEQVLHAIRPYLRYIDSSRYIDDLANGDICLAMGWSGDIKQARDRASEAGKGVNIDYSIPREGAIRTSTCWRSPPTRRTSRNAHLFINFLLRPDIAARNSNLIKYANAVLPSSSRSTRRWRTTRASTRRRRYARGWSPSAPGRPLSSALLTRMWTRFKTGK